MIHGLGPGEVLAPLPMTIAPATQLRGTALTTSYQLVREAGLEGRYRDLLTPEFAADLPATTALHWYPMPVALQHYRVMDQLFPDPTQQINNGRRSSEITQNAHLKTLVRGLSSAGPFQPQAILRRAPTLFGRMLVGGGVGVWQLGPKDVRLELHGYAMVRFAYVRNGWQGMLESAMSLFTRRCFVRQDAAFLTPQRMALVLSWV